MFGYGAGDATLTHLGRERFVAIASLLRPGRLLELADDATSVRLGHSEEPPAFRSHLAPQREAALRFHRAHPLHTLTGLVARVEGELGVRILGLLSFEESLPQDIDPGLLVVRSGAFDAACGEVLRGFLRGGFLAWERTYKSHAITWQSKQS